jgi:hypothetical protein
MSNPMDTLSEESPMNITHRTVIAVVAGAVAAASVTSVGAVQAIDEAELERRMALADFQQVEKPDWDPARFGELAAEFGVGDTVVTPEGFAQRDTRTSYFVIPGPAIDMHELLEDGDWDSAAFPGALAEHLEHWPD